MIHRNALFGIAFVFFGLAPSSGYEAAQWKAAQTLENLDIKLDADSLQAVVEADGVMVHRVYQVEDPPQLILDIMNVRNPLEGQQPKEPHPLIGRVQSQELPMTAYDRAAPRESTFARIIFELKQPARHSTSVAPGRIELALYPREETSSNGGGGEGSEAPAAADSPFPAGHPIEPEDVDPAVFFGLGQGGPEQYRIGAEDVIEVRVFELNQLDRTVRVEVDGNIILPLIGSVNVDGLTARQATEQVAVKLRELVDDPQVTVLVKEYHSQNVSFLGAVARPDAYPLMGQQRNLLQLIAKAGGLSPEAGSVLYVFRQLPDGRSARLSVPLSELLVQGDPRWNIRLKPGDVVSVPLEEAISVSIVGAVVRPGVYKLPAGDGATLLVLVARAGGFKDRASKGNVQIKRRDASGEETVFKVDAGEILSGEKPDVILKEGDVVVVKQSFF